jgi:hypothetical protein
VTIDKPLTKPTETTKANVLKAMGDGHDVWYIVCHGAIEQTDDSDQRRAAWLLLTDENGNAEPCPIADFEKAVNELRVKPSLVFLLACQGGGTGKYLGGVGPRDRNVSWALAPRLVRTGIPAVIAMQGQIAQETARAFAQDVMQDLRRHGDVERAVAYGRRRPTIVIGLVVVKNSGLRNITCARPRRGVSAQRVATRRPRAAAFA